MSINTNHDITSLRITKKTLERIQQYTKLYMEYGVSMDRVVNALLNDSLKLHQPRNSKGQFTKQEIKHG